jgi:hypothetical protein
LFSLLFAGFISVCAARANADDSAKPNKPTDGRANVQTTAYRYMQTEPNVNASPRRSYCYPSYSSRYQYNSSARYGSINSDLTSRRFWY